ncbi:RHS repeat-associated core domain-containing protein [Catenulispora sp. EB89]|uniref:RHS repeat domain-containing protein n=1 Tax=Catenulispora sp. EB89 TaxID=3156257 RepID=UPI003511A2BB
MDADVPGAPWQPTAIKAPPVPKGAPITAAAFPAAATDELTLAASAPTARTMLGSQAIPQNSAMVRSAYVPVSVGQGSADAASPSAMAAAKPGSTAPAATSPATKVKVSVADQSVAKRVGVSGVVVSVSRSDGKTQKATVDVAVDYSAFSQVYGGDYASRLRLVALPACALTTPAVPACQTEAPVAFRNDLASHQLIGTVTLDSSPAAGTKSATTDATSDAASAKSAAAAPAVVLAATSTPSGAQGSYTATSLSASNNWSESGNTGDFSYQYPISVPAALGGAAPSVALSYDSGSVDGHSSVENGQASSIGDGWDYSPGYIERTYVPCTSAKPTAYATSTDNCFARDASGKLIPALTLSFGAHGGQLVHDDSDTTNTHYKLPTDDGTQVDVLNGTTNGTVGPDGNAGEYMRVRLADGTVAYFGADKLPAEVNGGTIGTDTPTQSAWYEPAFNNPGKPTTCQDPTTASPTACRVAWRWNLDYTVDPHGMVTKYLYNREFGKYGRTTANTATDYVRGGELSEIDYGWTTADVAAGRQPAAKVLFTSVNRCVDPAWDGGYGGTSGGSAGCENPTSPISLQFQDTPTDMVCAATPCEQWQNQPTFFSSLMLGSITTKVAVNGAYQNVDHYDLFHQFHQLTDSDAEINRPPLWLAAIRHCTGVDSAPGQVCADAEQGASGSRTGIEDASGMPDIQFLPYATGMANRVDGVKDSKGTVVSGLLKFYRERLGYINDELNAQIAVTYDDPTTYALGCTAPPASPDWHNTKLCYPEYWTPPGYSTPITDWFHKYVVTQVTVADSTFATRTDTQTTAYTYDTTTGAAWHSNDSDLITDANTRTYDQYRGFQTVTTTTGAASDPAGTPQSKTVTTYLRGMNWDPDQAGAKAGSVSCGSDPRCPTVNVADTLGGSTQDDNALSGMTLETQTFTSASGGVWSEDVTRPWMSAPMAQHNRVAPLPAQRSRELATATELTRTVTADNGSGPGTRTTQTDYTYDQGTPAATSATGSHGGRLTATWVHSPVYSKAPAVADTSPDVCTSTAYASNPAKSWMLDFADDTTSWTTTPAAGCWDGNGAPLAHANNQVVSESRTFYDDPNATSPGTLTLGETRKTDVLDHFDTNPVYVTKSKTDYDGYGRVTAVTDPLGKVTSTSYTPAYAAGVAGELPRQSKVVGPTGQATTTTLDPKRGLATDVLDPNNNTTHIEYDALGRRSKVWLAGHPKASYTNAPSLAFHYTVTGSQAAPGATGTLTNTSAPSLVETDTLREDLSYSAAYSYIDSMGRTRQTQGAPVSGDSGRIITDTQYDSHGNAYLSTGPYLDTAAPGANLWVNSAPVPRATQTVFDGMSRATQTRNLSVLSGSQIVLTHSDTAYPGADRTDSSPAVKQGDPAPDAGRTSTYTDARGLKNALYTYRSGNPAFGNAAGADVTTYGYDAAGRQNQVKDAAGNTWTDTFNLAGLKLASTDPDTGNSSYGYDAAGNLTDVKNGRNQQLHYKYDDLGRKIGEWSGWGTAAETAANQLASWSFDNSRTGAAVPNGQGQNTGWARYTAGANGPAYTSDITGFTASGQPLSTTLTIPADGTANTGLVGTYTTNNTYTPNTGLLDHIDLPSSPSTAGASALQPDTVYNSYNANGLLVAAGDSYANLLSDSSYTPFGEVMARQLGDYPNQVVQKTNYDSATRRVLNVDVSATSIWNASVDHWDYSYRADGQITGIRDLQGTAGTVGSNNVANVSTQTDLQCFTYDYADRLTAAWTDSGGFSTGDGGIGGCANGAPNAANRTAATSQVNSGPAPYWETFGYDNATGNRTSETDYNPAGTAANDVTTTYGYGNAGAQPHTVTSAKPSNQVTANTYVYDTAGNTTSRPGSAQAQTLTWDSEDRLGHVANNGTTVDYVYAPDGTQLLRRDSGKTTLYLNGAEIYVSGGQVTGNRYFTYDGAPTIVESGGGTPVVSYEVTNQQGTSSTTLNASVPTGGAASLVAGRVNYTPFNTVRGTKTGTFVDDHTFLGKTTDSTTGLVDIGARKYDPILGRFLTADPVFQPDNPQALGGYAYASDDPISQMDPTGLWGFHLKSLFKAAVKVVNTVAAAAPVLNYVAAATVEIPGLDVVTAGMAAVGDAAVVTSTAIGVVQGGDNVYNDVKDGKGFLQTGMDVVDTIASARGLKGAGRGLRGAEDGALPSAFGGKMSAAEEAEGPCSVCGEEFTQREQDTLQVGPYATNSVQPRMADGTVLPDERAAIQDDPCHTCGDSYPGSMRGDHQPSTSRMPDGKKVYDGIWAHCPECSDDIQPAALRKLGRMMEAHEIGPVYKNWDGYLDATVDIVVTHGPQGGRMLAD